MKERKMTHMKATLLCAAALTIGLGTAAVAESEVHIEDIAFAHEGPFGTYDQMQLQRGLQVYTEVCAACHGLQYVRFGTLSDEGGPMLPEDQVRQYAADFPIYDEDSNRQYYDVEKGEFRLLAASDTFPAHNLAAAPDLSLMAKKRAGFHGPYGTGINQLMRGMGGPEYIHAILTGYIDPPACAPDDFTGYYNEHFPNGGYPDECKIFEERVTQRTNADGTVTDVTEKVEIGRTAPGSWIAMPPPISDDIVTYADGTPATTDQISQDVSAFLMWTAEPKLGARKEAGFIGVFILGLFAVMLYLVNKQLWANIKGRKDS
jgi:ubiquinol-cytochrome c reductase cytochrome c1 subunit